MEDRRHGPFTIIEKVGSSAYRLKLPPTWAIRDTFNESLLTPYRPSKYKSQQKPPPPPPIQTEEGEEHEVDHIRDSRTRRGRTEYLVHWKGYPREDDTWEPASNLKHAQHVLKDFLNSRPSPQILRHLRSEPSSDPKLFDWNATKPTLIQKTRDETTNILLRTTIETMDDILAQ